MGVGHRRRRSNKIYAYDLTTKQRVPGKDFENDYLVAAGNDWPTHIWSDGVTMWVTNFDT